MDSYSHWIFLSRNLLKSRDLLGRSSYDFILEHDFQSELIIRIQFLCWKDALSCFGICPLSMGHLVLFFWEITFKSDLFRATAFFGFIIWRSRCEFKITVIKSANLFDTFEEITIAGFIFASFGSYKYFFMYGLKVFFFSVGVGGRWGWLKCGVAFVWLIFIFWAFAEGTMGNNWCNWNTTNRLNKGILTMLTL